MLLLLIYFEMIEKQRFLLNLIENKRMIFLFKKYYSDIAETNNNEKVTHFGFKTIKESDKVKEGVLQFI